MMTLDALRTPDETVASLPPESAAALDVLRSNNARMTDRLSSVAERLVGGSSASRAEPAVPTTADVLQRIESLNQLTNNPESLLSRVDAHIDDLHEHSPQTAQSLAATLTRAVTYLQGEAPQSRMTGPLAKPQPPSRAELAAWDRKFQVATNPMEALQNGGLDADAARTLQAVYPKLYAQLQEQTLDRLMSQPDVPYQRRLQVARILGTDLDGTTTRAMVQANLALSADVNTQAAQTKPPPKGGLRTAKFTGASEARTPMQRVTTGSDK